MPLDGCKWHLRARQSCQPSLREATPRGLGSEGHVVNKGSPGRWVLWMPRAVAAPWGMRPQDSILLQGWGWWRGRDLGWGWWAETPVPPGRRLSGGCVQITGRWYTIGLASNSNWFKNKKHLMKMCTTDISTTADGNLEVTSTYPKYGHGEQVGKQGVLPCGAWGSVQAGAAPRAPLTSSCCAPQG